MSLFDAKQIKNLAHKLPVRVVTTTALAAGGTPVYNNGTSGFGATLTAAANSLIDVVNGVTLAVGDRILNNHDATTANRGIYVVTAVGSGAAKWILTRASDADTAIKTFTGISVVTGPEGTTNKNAVFTLQTSGAITIGTTAQTWGVLANPVSAISSNKQMAASATTTDGSAACATAMVSTPSNGGYVQIFVNGQKQVLGDGVKTKDCYFSADGGSSAKAIASIVAGDLLYWNGSVASWQLATTDSIDFDYST